MATHIRKTAGPVVLGTMKVEHGATLNASRGALMQLRYGVVEVYSEVDFQTQDYNIGVRFRTVPEIPCSITRPEVGSEEDTLP